MRKSRRSLLFATCASVGILAASIAAPALADDNEATTSVRQVPCELQKDRIADVPEQKIVAAWNEHDATKFANLFTEDASLVLPSADIYMKNRDQIRAMMAGGFSGPLGETTLAQRALSVKCVDRHSAVVITQGGIMFPGETEVDPSRIARETYVLVSKGHEWLITAYHNSKIS